MKKMYRSCTRVRCVQEYHQRCLYERSYDSDDLQAFINNPEQFIVEHTLSILKKGNTCTVFKVKMGMNIVAIKRYNVKHFWHGVRLCFRRSRASRSWYYAHLLGFYRLNTAKPIALLEKRIGFIRRESYYISEYVSGGLLSDYFNAVKEITRNVRRVADNMIHLMHQLLYFKLSHGDMKATNFIVQDGEIVILDLDAMKQYDTMEAHQRAYQHDVARFMKNWKHHPMIEGLFSCLITKK